jgi:hypothetical protein
MVYLCQSFKLVDDLFSKLNYSMEIRQYHYFYCIMCSCVLNRTKFFAGDGLC